MVLMLVTAGCGFEPREGPYTAAQTNEIVDGWDTGLSGFGVSNVQGIEVQDVGDGAYRMELMDFQSDGINTTTVECLLDGREFSCTQEEPDWGVAIDGTWDSPESLHGVWAFWTVSYWSLHRFTADAD